MRRPDGDAHGVGARTGFEESLRCALASGIGDVKGDVRFVGELIEPASAAEEFEIVKLFVGGNFTGLGTGMVWSEEVSERRGRSRCAGDLGAPASQAASKRFGGEGAIEFAVAEFVDEFFAAAPAAMLAVGIVGDELIADLLVAIDVGYVGTDDDGDLRIGVALADGAEGGEAMIASPTQLVARIMIFRFFTLVIPRRSWLRGVRG